MNTKLSYMVGTGLLFAAIGIAWSCATSETDVDDAAGFRGFNEPLSGAIFTTLSDGSSVNANIYPAKEDVYLDGGPGIHAPASAAGLPEGDYYFQVTDPSGQDLLSTDHISCRKVHVNSQGVISRSYPGTNYAWQGGDWVAAPCQHETGVDQDHSDAGAITVQLMPYDNTPNNGGVYKAWLTPVAEYTGDANFVPTSRKDEVNGALWEPGNFHGFVPAHSKTDNYKVRKNGRPQVLTLRKFHDANINGTMDPGEEEISGWEVELNDPLGTSNRYFTPAQIYVSEGLWAAQEATPAGTMITVATLDGAIQSLYPDADPLVVVTVEGLNDERHEVVYGDVGVGAVSACKFYDADADGEVDEGEIGVEGWRFELVGTDVRGQSVGPITATTGSDGCASFAELLPGEYTISEQSSGGDWVSSGPTSQAITIASTLDGSVLGGTQVTASFTNYCQGSATFGTKGYWHNKNGLNELEDAVIEYANTLRPYTEASTYFDAGDEPFDGQFADGSDIPPARGPESELLAAAGTARAEISYFLVDANADGDPREQLAQQLLAFIFNAHHRLDGPEASIRLADGSFVAASALIEQAIETWTSGDAQAQVAIKDTLDAFNNSDAVVFVYTAPCTLP